MKPQTRGLLLGVLLTILSFGLLFAQEPAMFERGITLVRGMIDIAGTSSSTIRFEGATADAFETIIVATDVTADRTVTLPNSTAAFFISTLTTNDVDAANSIWAVSNNLVFEGATADAFEISLVPADPTADATVTIPDLTGNVSIMGLIAAGATETAAAVTHVGACIALDTGAGSVVTLPAATGTGNRYCFVVTATGAHQINVVGNDEFVGGIIQGNDTNDTIVMWPAADAADNDRISLNGTSQGGFVGSVYWIVDISTDNWQVIGYSDASGTEATPFVTGQVT